MAHSWPAETVFRQLTLDVEDRHCAHCGRTMHVCTHRGRRLFTLAGPLQLRLRLFHCPLVGCPGHAKTFSSEAELSVSMPWWSIGWDVFAWIGHRRFSRHWSVPQIRGELRDSFAIDLSEDAIERHIQRYQIMLAARQQDFELLRDLYRDADGFHLTIDGLQPEKGRETLYVVRELSQKRVWFAEPLVSSSESEVRRLLVRARQVAEELGKPVLSWMSDKQEAFVKGIAGEFPEAPHRDCQNHFLRDLALKEVNESLQRNLAAKKGGLRRTRSIGSRATSAADLPKSKRSRNKSVAMSATSRR